MGKAFVLVFMIIGFAFLLPSVLLALIAGIGQCALGGKKEKVSIGFAIPALLAHAWAVVVFVWNTIMSFNLETNRILPSLAYIFPALLSLAIFVFTIVALATRTKFIQTPIVAILEEDQPQSSENTLEKEIDEILNAEIAVEEIEEVVVENDE